MTRIDRLTARRDAARLEWERARYALAARHLTALYDGAESSHRRRTAAVERTDDDGVLTLTRRLTGVAQTRDLARNYSNAKGMLHQFAVNVVGTLGKLQVNLIGDEAVEARRYFNETWAKGCDARDDNHWSDLLQCFVTGVLREGDVGIAIDDGWLDDTGQLWAWEADQFCNVEEGEFRSRFPEGHTQQQGVVRDRLGRIVGYYVTGKHGAASCKADEATFFSRSNMRLLKRPWRVNQGRGIADMLTAVNDMFDLYDARARELQTMKTAAALAGYTKRTDAVTDFDAPLGGLGLLPENTGQTPSEIHSQESQGGSGKNYERFEALTGGVWEYLDKGDDVVFPDFDRPSPNMEEFHDFVLSSAGASMGLARAYARMRADSSYTSFRGDMIMSWATFYAMQKWLERRCCDWVAQKVLARAQKRGDIPTLPAGWERSLSWQWPSMPEVDEAAIETAIERGQRNGTRTLSDTVGPAWAEKIAQLGRERQAAIAAGVTLPTMTTVSGAQTTPQKPEE